MIDRFLLIFMLQFPSSEEQWRKIADAFHTRWQFPNFIGTMDGKHIVMQAVPGRNTLTIKAPRASF